LDFNTNPIARSLYSLKIYVELETKKGLDRLDVEVSGSHTITRTHTTHTHARARGRTDLNE
jgi:hypothetical protein